MSTPPEGSGWRMLTRADLTTFDNVMTDIVLEYMDLGWFGRMSTKGHALLRAPDGKETTSVSRNSNRGSSGTRARADLERWKANRPGRAFGIAVDQPSADGPFESLAEVENYRAVKNDSRVKNYLRDLAESGLTRDAIVDRFLVNVSTENKDDWYAIDTAMHKVIAWGGNMTEAEAYSVHYNTPKEEPVTITEEAPVTVKLYRCEEPGCLESFDSRKALGGHKNGHKPLVRCEQCAWEGAYIAAHMRRAHLPDTAEEAWDGLSPEAQGEVEDLLAQPAWDELPSARAEYVEPEETVVMGKKYPRIDALAAVQYLVAEVEELRQKDIDFMAASAAITDLRAELAQVTKERDDLQARLELLRETLSL